MKTFKLVTLSMVLCLLMIGMVHARTYKIAVVSWAGWSPIHVAEAKGFWKSENIDVKVVTTSNPIECINLLKDRIVDLSFDMIGSVVGLYMEGIPIVIIAETDWSHGGDKIIIKRNSIPENLKEKPIGVYFHKPSVLYFLGKYLSTIGINLSEIRVVEMESDALSDNFIAGRLSAIVNYDPAALRAQREGNGKVVATSADYEGVIPEGVIALKDVAKSIPQEDMIKILRGWIQAVKWVHNPQNWAEYMIILNEKTFINDPPFSEKDLKDMIDAVRIHNPEMMLERNRMDGGLYNYLKDLKSFLKTNGLLQKDFDLNEILFLTPIIEALK